MTSASYQRGAALLQQNRPDEYHNLTEHIARISPDMSRHVIEHAYGDVWSGEAIDQKTRALATVSALAAMGGTEPQLKSHIRGALKVGWSAPELAAILTHLHVYCGMPRAINALTAAQEVFAAEGVSPADAA